MIPSPLLVVLAIAPVVLAILTLVDPSMLWTMLLTDGVIALLAGADAWLAYRPLVTISRTTRDVFSIGQPNPVRLEIRSLARRALSLVVKDDLFDHSESDDLPLELTLAPRARATLVYHVKPTRRGAHELGDHYVRYLSPLRLWIRQVRIPATDVIKVYPDVRAVRTYELLAVTNREQSLFRASKRKGGESEFERLREYRREDEYRAIDWKATARRRSLIAREYQMESNQSIVFALDAGRLMTAETAGLSLFDHALNATLMLSHVAAKNGDCIGLFSFTDQVKSYAPLAAGQKATQRIIRAGYDLQPDLVETSYRVALEQLSTRVRKRAMIVMFTQVVDEVAAAELLRLTRGLSRRHLPLLVLFRDPDVEQLLEPTAANVLAAYTRAAAAEVVEWRDRLNTELKKQGAHILDVMPRDLTPALINRYLEIKARHLL